MKALKQLFNPTFFGLQSWYLLLFSLIGIILAFASAPIINPDGIEYIVVARHYAALDFTAAINGIWSPLLSWILIIPILIGSDPFLFFRLAVVAAATATLVLTNKLLGLWFQSSEHRFITATSIAFVSLFGFYAIALTPITSDFFTVLFTVATLLVLTKYQYKSRTRTAMLMGLVSGFGFYAKSYFLYFALASIIFYFIYRLFTAEKAAQKRIIKDGVLAFLSCCLAVAPWVIAMTYKYDEFTLNPIGSYAISQVGPDYAGAPVTTLGLLDPPPYANSLTAREDPSSFDYTPWSPLESKSDLKYYLGTVLPNNIWHGVKILAPVLVMLMIAIFSLLHESRKKIAILRDFRFLSLVVASAIYTGGYCLVHIEGGFRYLWPAYFLLSLAFFLLIPKLNKKLRIYILIVGTLVLSLYPIQTSVRYTFRAVEASQDARQLSKLIESSNTIKEGSRIASNSPYAAANVCYFLSLKCYGTPMKGHLNEQIERKKIKYVLNFKDRRPLNVPGKIIFNNKELSIIHTNY